MCFSDSQSEGATRNERCNQKFQLRLFVSLHGCKSAHKNSSLRNVDQFYFLKHLFPNSLTGMRFKLLVTNYGLQRHWRGDAAARIRRQVEKMSSIRFSIAKKRTKK